jgi:serine/threonine-protein kinase
MLFIIVYNMPGLKGRDIGKDSTLVRNRIAEMARAKADPDRLLGNMLAERYMIKERIGEGGMGTIYLAEDGNLDGKKVAVKVLPAYLAKMPAVVSRFIQEARLAPRIDHENIINVTDRGTTPEGVPFFVMEHLKGMDLCQALATVSFGWSQRTADIILQVSRALHKAHEYEEGGKKKPIIHRDLKPENVFILERSDGKDFVKVLDFGIAKMLEQAQSFEVDETGEIMPVGPKMTQQGVVMGTPSYMPPEQARGEKTIDHRADIYALGTMLYEMVCGVVPFDSDDENPNDWVHKIIDMQKNAEPLPMSRRRPDLKIPHELEALVMKALRKDPGERFQSMKEFDEALSAIPVPQQAPAKSQSEIRFGSRSIIGYREIQKAEGARVTKRRRTVAAAVIALAVAAAGIAAYKLHPEAPERFSPATRTEPDAEAPKK